MGAGLDSVSSIIRHIKSSSSKYILSWFSEQFEFQNKQQDINKFCKKDSSDVQVCPLHKCERQGEIK